MVTRGEACYSRKFTDKFLTKAKSCTYVQLNSLSQDEQGQGSDMMDDVTGEVLRIICGVNENDVEQTGI
jgi:hypothetical protein